MCPRHEPALATNTGNKPGRTKDCSTALPLTEIRATPPVRCVLAHCQGYMDIFNREPQTDVNKHRNNICTD